MQRGSWMDVKPDRFLFSGTGGSMGVPVIGCTCPVCESTVKENKRLRSAGFLFAQGKTIAVDAGPDFRTQCLRYGIGAIDGIFVTHTHADHINGLDDVRIFHFRKNAPIPCMLSKESIEDVESRFHYFFPPFEGDMSQSKKLDLQVVDKDFGAVSFLDIPFTVVTYYQAGMKITGFRYKSFAYITDIQTFSDEIYEHLYGLDTLVLSALRWTPSLVHFTIDDALTFIDKVNPKKALLTHIAHDLEHHDTLTRLPAHVRVAYDGLEVLID